MQEVTPDDSTSPQVRPGLRTAQAVTAGLLIGIGFPPIGIAPALPFGVALLLWSISGLASRPAFYVGFACGMAMFGSTIFWLANLFGAASVTLMAIAASFIGIFSALYVWLVRSLPVSKWFVLPIVWVGVELFRSEIFTLKFGWIGLGYALVEQGRFVDVASVFGSYGLSFLVVLAGTGLAFGNAKTRLVTTAVWLALFALPSPKPTMDRPLNVRMVQGFLDEDALFKGSASTAKADVILWPEYSFMLDPTRDPKLWERLQGVAITNQAHFIFGAERYLSADGNRYENTAFVLNPKGEVIGTHVKNHLVHFIQDGVAGTKASAVPSQLGELGVAICFDMDFPDVARRLAQNGAEVFLIPNMDPSEWGPVQRAQHRLMFQMRAAENGKWLARADVSGGTSVSAPNGRQTASVITSEPAVLEAKVGRTRQRTLYTSGGWLFGHVCLAVSLVGVAGAAIRLRGDEMDVKPTVNSVG